MKPNRFFIAALSLAVLCFFTVCDNGVGTFSIDDLTAVESQITPGESTVLHCYVDNPDTLQLDYVWEADTGSIESMGDSAVWTAPEDMTWTSYTASVTVTVGDEDGNTEDESIDLQVEINPQSIYASEDTYTFGYAPDNSYDTGAFLRVGYDENWEDQNAFFHTFIKFPTPDIPSGEEIRGARIRLYREYGEGEEMEVEVYLPRDDWSAGGLTWNTEPDADDFAMLDDNTTDVGYLYIGLLSLVEDWIEGTEPNYGVMLRVLDETDHTHRFRDYGALDGVESKRPVLEVVSW